MRVVVSGAGGKVGKALVARIAASEGMVLSGAPGRGATGAIEGDVVIDFSSPAGTMALLDRLADDPLPVVVGTTGLDAGQAQRLVAEGARRPILVAANFTPGFAAFRASLLALAQALPQARLTLSETYNAAKSPKPSGTTLGLRADILALDPERALDLDLRREGDAAGITTLGLALDSARIALTLKVDSRDAYAAGALQAARWLIGRPPGHYTPSDML